MNTDPNPNLHDPFPLPKGMIRHTTKIGAYPISEFVPVPVSGRNGASSDPRPEFKICWEDQQQGLRVLVREREDGHLIADVFCSNAGLLGQAAMSVGLVGAGTTDVILKAIPLNMPEKNGCSGSADLGSLASAVKQLGSQLGLVVMLSVRKSAAGEMTGSPNGSPG